MTSLDLYLFGNPRLERDKRALKVRRRKSVALLAYLAVTGRPHNRDALATMLWPEHDQSGARANLRRELSRLKRAIGGENLEADRTQARISPEGNLWNDVVTFRTYLQEAQEHEPAGEPLCEACAETVAQAVALYRDDFMAGFTLPDCPEFDEWQFFEAEGLRQSLAGALQLLIDRHVAEGTFDRAIEYGRRWVALDSLHEPAHRHLMKLYAWAGQQAAALRQYEECVRLLEEELGVEPAPETVALYEAIHARQLPPPEKLDKAESDVKVATLPPEDRFVLDEQLAVGGQSEVFRGRDRTTDKPVIIKRIRGELVADPEQVARFVREGEALAQLNHPNIVRILAAFEHDGEHCIVMEYMPGGSLRELLDVEQPLPVDRALEIALELADALSRAHHLGIVHRDLKPENVLLAADGTPRLTDFGMARLERDDSQLTRTGAFLGSPAYMSPEALRGETLDGRSDVWSFGVLLFEMLAGQRPFKGERVTQVLVSILNDPAPSLNQLCPGAPAPLAALVRRMLVKNRDARIHSMRLVAAGLEAIRDDQMDSWLGEQVAAAMASQIPRQQSAPTPAMRQPVLTGETEQPADPAVVISPARDVISGETAPFLVAREQEMARLNRYLKATLAGQLQIAFVTGEAGEGKTTLLQAFAWQAQENHHKLLVAGGQGNAYTGIGDPYLPFRGILEFLTGGVEAYEASRARHPGHAQRVSAVLPLAIRAIVESGPDLIDVFVGGRNLLDRASALFPKGTPWLERLQLLVDSPAQQAGIGVKQSSLFEQYARVIQTLARRRPLLLLLDDLQWVDQPSANLLFHLARRLAGSPVLIVGAYRPVDVALGRQGERHPLDTVLHELQRQFGDVILDLSQTEGRAFVKALLDAEPNHLSASFRDTLYHQTGGQPLFTVELLHGMQERGDLKRDDTGHWIEQPGLDWKTLPARVEGAIGERVARMDPSLKELLQVASVEGEEFTAEVVAGVLDAEPREIARRLSRYLEKGHRLVHALGVRREGGRRLSRYRFQHILIQRYLYESLDEVEKKHYHESVARMLEELYGEQSAEVAVDLAWHFGRAEMEMNAVAYLQHAAEKALQRSAHGTAIRHLTRGFEILEKMPDTPERAGKELMLQAMLGPALIATKGWGDPEVEEVYVRAHSLSARLGHPPQLGPVLYGLASLREYRGEYEDAEALLEERLQLPEAEEDPALRLESHELLACSTFHQGAFTRTLEHAQKGLSLYEPRQHSALIPLHGKNLETFLHVWAAHSLWFLGYPDQAFERIQEGHRVAKQLEHTFSLVSVQIQASFLYQFARETGRARDLAEQAILLATEHEYAYRVAEGKIIRGWALAAAGNSGAGLDELSDGLDAYQAMGSRVDLPYFLALKAETLRYAGRINESLATVEEALAVVPGDRAFFYEAELYRLRGDLLLQQDEAQNAEAAEASFDRALEVARNQQSKTLELRAAVSLFRLWQKQGREADAHALLGSVYGWFTEGFETADLQEVPALLARAESAGNHRDVAFVGREQEMAHLNRWLAAALEGRHRVVFATGGAGQGKTALIQAFCDAAQEKNASLIAASGSGNAYTGTGDPYLPFREILELLTGDVDVQAPDGIARPEYVRRLRALLPIAAEALVESGPDLIDTFVAGRHLLQRAAAIAPSGASWLKRLEEIVHHNAAGESAARLQQAALFEQYARVVQSISRRHPLLLLLDDLQWADAGSAALLLHLGRRLSGSRVLILGAYRPAEIAWGRGGERHPLEMVINELRRDFGDIFLELNQAEGRAFVDSLLDSEPNRLSDSFRETLFRQTGGHPLFTIELLRSMQERDDVARDEDGCWVARPDLDWQMLPARVEGVIGERVGRLDSSLRELLRVASVEGEQFSAEVIARVLDQDRREIARRLGRELEGRHHLVQALGVSREDSVRLSRYRFRHILIQSFLYNGLDEVERAYQHEAVGEALESLYGEQASAVAVQLARHFGAAGNRQKAALYLRKAGDQAWNAAALKEAARYYATALDQWPANDEEGRAELLRRLGECQWVSGHTEDALESFIRARDLFAAVDDKKGLGAVYRLIGRLHWEQGNRKRSLKKYYRALEILQEGPESVELAWAVSSISQMHMLASEYEAAVEWGERALELARKLESYDVMAHALNNVGTARIWIGEPDRGEEMLRESLRLALEMRTPHDTCRALLNLGEGLVVFGSDEGARKVLTELLEYATSVQAPLFAGSALVELARLDWQHGMWASALSRRPEIEQWIGRGQSLRYVAVIRSTLFGRIYNDLGAADLAWEILQEKLARARRMSELQTTVPHLGELVRALTLKGEEEDAAAIVDEYLRLTEEGAYFLHWNISRLLFMCRWLAERSEIERVRWSVQRLQEALGQFGSMEAEASVHESRGILALAEKEPPGTAAQHFRRAARWWRQMGRPYDRVRALKDLGQSLFQAGERKEAQEALEKAAELVEALAAQLEEDMREIFLSSPLVAGIQETRQQVANNH